MNSDIINTKLGNEIIDRLNAIIALLLKSNFSDNTGKLNIKESVQFLYKQGIKPNTIANIIGKEKSTDIAPYLYTTKKKLKPKKDNQLSI